MTLKRVVLPEPFGPISPVIVPAWTSTVQPFSACTPPNALLIPAALRRAVMGRYLPPLAHPPLLAHPRPLAHPPPLAVLTCAAPASRCPSPRSSGSGPAARRAPPRGTARRAGSGSGNCC